MMGHVVKEFNQLSKNWTFIILSEKWKITEQDRGKEET